MTKEAKVIKLPAESELAGRLKEAAEAREPVVVDTGEARYTIAVDALRDGAKPLLDEEVERSRGGIRKALGGWKDMDTEAFKAYIAERRHTANRPPVRL